jgi:hypothetical protein
VSDHAPSSALSWPVKVRGELSRIEGTLHTRHDLAFCGLGGRAHPNHPEELESLVCHLAPLSQYQRATIFWLHRKWSVACSSWRRLLSLLLTPPLQNQPPVVMFALIVRQLTDDAREDRADGRIKRLDDSLTQINITAIKISF